jgi:protein involved in polysaccharide export with SLBB domain
LLVAVLTLLGKPAAGQDLEGSASYRPIATRADLEASLAEAERLAASEAYSAEFRETKRAEARLIRERLTEGDFQVGDQINLTLVGDSSYQGGVVQVAPGRVVAIPGLPDIPIRGVLRSEIEPYLTAQIGRYIREPQLKARALIRLSVLGSVGKPGFYQLEAEMLLSDALTTAGGIGNGSDLKRSEILRGEEPILDGERFQAAITEGRSLDQLNLRAGDVIKVAQVTKRDLFTTLRTVAIIPGLILSTYGLGKLFGIF